MRWRLIKLEHAPTARFPNGSAARGYVLRLPLQADGTVDDVVHKNNRLQSTARRFWPSEPEWSGFVIRRQQRWNVVEDCDQPTGAEFAWFKPCAFVEGVQIEITEGANGKLPFCVVSTRLG